MSTYRVLTQTLANDESSKWKMVWGLNSPQRPRTFLWLTLHGRLLTNEERFRRHIADSTKGTICYSENGSSLIPRANAITRFRPYIGEFFLRQSVGSYRSEDWVKANTDGAMGGPNLMAAAGGVIRDSQGDWIISFARSLGICSTKHAET
ncbi:uncharacterized protein LOC120207822 [Hibiscus syriacus]|uniref:uncharacterized protein LOC120207822 n=1 Tax=Hibiscus syriacus TaxID=106335 RepID=UPI0019216C19|nr:uncharacterized protein LOC120207822 [Hibiscus syriacus]